jgi:hypothetical protein
MRHGQARSEEMTLHSAGRAAKRSWMEEGLELFWMTLIRRGLERKAQLLRHWVGL